MKKKTTGCKLRPDLNPHDVAQQLPWGTVAIGVFEREMDETDPEAAGVDQATLIEKTVLRVLAHDRERGVYFECRRTQHKRFSGRLAAMMQGKMGHPKTGRNGARRELYVSEEDAQLLRHLGKGNMSAGLRALAEHYREPSETR